MSERVDPRTRRRLAAAGVRWSAALIVLAAAAGCAQPPASADIAASSSPAGPARYAISGTVVAQPDSATVTLAHDAVKNFMPAMVMDLRGEALPRLRPGDRIHGTLAVSSDGSRLIEVVVAAASAPVVSEVVIAAASPGTTIPDVVLRNQRDETIRMGDFRGRVLLVTFIYTRCPLPDFCPRLMRNFQELRRALVAEPDVSPKVQFLSVSIDPTVDTPQVLAAYSQALLGAMSPPHWDLATGDAKDIGVVAAFAGLRYEPDAGLVRHSMETLIVGADGRLITRYSGTSWNHDEALRIVSREARRAD